MSLEAVRTHFAQYDLDHRILVLENSTATVEEAAREHGVDPGQIAKTLAFRQDGEPILIVVAGTARIDNRKYRQHFGSKARMLSADETLAHTGHAIGGVCPFGLPGRVDVFLDISLREHAEVIPAAGNRYSAIRLSIAELETCSNSSGWIDVCGQVTKR